MTRSRLEFDPYLHDPSRWGASMAHMAELMLPCLDAVRARHVIEVGALAGDLTRVIVHWAASAGARVTAVDPVPGASLVELARERPELELDRRTSLDALPDLPAAEAIVLDGDHNWYTVTGELSAIETRAGEHPIPLVLLHDVGWPHARRDDFFDVAQIPAEFTHPQAGAAAGLVPGDAGTQPDGLPYPRSAAREGGERNGVLTAAEDFVAEREGLRLVVVPAFFGLGAVWDERAPWAADVAAILDPWDRHPMLQRLEENRLHQLATAHARHVEIVALHERLARQETVLRRQLDSSAFAVAGWLSRLRRRAGIADAQSEVSKDAVRGALGG